MTLQTFLFTLFGKQEKGGEREDKKLEMEILQEIGMQRFVHFHSKLGQSNLYPICLLFFSLSHSGCESQLACLLSLKLPYLYSTLELFVHWIQDGIYDFHHLPLVMKKHLEDRDIEKLQEVIGKYDGKWLGTQPELPTVQQVCILNLKLRILWFLNLYLTHLCSSLHCTVTNLTGTAEHLQDELSTLTNVLMHAESYVRKNIAENVQVGVCGPQCNNHMAAGTCTYAHKKWQDYKFSINWIRQASVNEVAHSMQSLHIYIKIIIITCNEQCNCKSIPLVSESNKTIPDFSYTTTLVVV